MEMRLNQNEFTQSVSIHGVACRALGSINKLSCTSIMGPFLMAITVLHISKYKWLTGKLHIRSGDSAQTFRSKLKYPTTDKAILVNPLTDRTRQLNLG